LSKFPDTAAHRAAWGEKPKPQLEVLLFHKVHKGTLRGFATIQFASGLRVIDCPVHVHSNGREWIGLPGKPLLDEEGRQRRDPITGKPVYVPVNQWSEKRIGDRFSELVIALIRSKWPDALDGGEP